MKTVEALPTCLSLGCAVLAYDVVYDRSLFQSLNFTLKESIQIRYLSLVPFSGVLESCLSPSLLFVTKKPKGGRKFLAARATR